MFDFSAFVYKIIDVLQNSEPIVILPAIIAFIIGLFSYFGFFYIFYRPKLPEKTFLNFQGMLFIFAYFFAFLWFTKTIIFPIIPGHELIISILITVLIIFYLFDLKTSIILVIVGLSLLILMQYYNYSLFFENIIPAITIVTFVYITLIVLSILKKCDAAENSLDYKGLYELELFSKYLSLESLQDIIKRNIKDNKSIIAYFEIQEKIYREMVKEIRKNIKFRELGSLLLNLIIFGPPRLILLLVLAYLNFFKNMSITLGILVFSYIFIALTLISIDKGISGDIFRYARVLIKRESSRIPKNIEGRVMRIDKEAIQLLVKHSDASVHLEYVPMDNIIQIELIKKPKSFGK